MSVVDASFPQSQTECFSRSNSAAVAKNFNNFLERFAENIREPGPGPLLKISIVPDDVASRPGTFNKLMVTSLDFGGLILELEADHSRADEVRVLCSTYRIERSIYRPDNPLARCIIYVPENIARVGRHSLQSTSLLSFVQEHLEPHKAGELMAYNPKGFAPEPKIAPTMAAALG